ncbi:uncharacterized protein J8A68_003367 [[Candida] subhashii]|uniref:F-box domain-containing protein n=1 Tax=[Candida] subhashii TaxID=561895 RepID=A0A8J5UWN4_9ASCO|nr:uncharacterized protein J8A68_003367 [[Candida] subhashii]KAG7663095.1 hypothetical protein J8A68_003367 [[Candida] subhashii]
MNVNSKDSPMKDANVLVDFPDEIWLQIFKHLSTFDLFKFQLLSKRLRNLNNQILWHSIYVYHPYVCRAGNPWNKHTWMSMGSFLHLSRSGKLKPRFMKELIFYGDNYMCLEWYKELTKTLHKCNIACFQVGQFQTRKNYYWTKVGHFYVSKRQGIEDHLDFHLIRSLRIGEVDPEFYQTVLPRFISLKSLHIDEPVAFKLTKRLRLNTLFLGSSRDVNNIIDNFCWQKLESLSLQKVPRNWHKLSQSLFSIKEIELDGTIKHLPRYSLSEVHYLNRIPEDDLKFLPYHPVTHLSVDSYTDYDQTFKLAETIESLRTLRVAMTTLRIVRSTGITQFVETEAREFM